MASHPPFRNTPPFERIAAQVDTVDIDKRVVHMSEKTRGKFQASFIYVDGAFQIPKQGEVWTVVRHGWQYHLEKRRDSVDEHATKTGLSAGDMHLRVPGTLHIDSKATQINSNATGVIKQERTNPGGSTASKTLTEPCVNPDSIQVFSSGLLVDPNTYTLGTDNQTLTFSPSLSAGVLVIYYER